MNKPFKTFISQLLILFMLMGFVGAQGLKTGVITYISKDNAYIDLGKKAGLQAGDSVQVAREGTILGVAIISQLSGSSAALVALDSVKLDWQIGDVVKIQRNIPEPPMIQELQLADSSTVEEVPMRVFLDSSAYEQRNRSSQDLDANRFAPTFTGYVSTRIDSRGGDPNVAGKTRGSVYGQFKVLDLGIRHLDASVYLRSNQSSGDQGPDTKLYSVMFNYQRPGSRFNYLFGRMYHPQFSTLGTIDGLGVTWRTDRRVVALVTGLEAAIVNLGNDTRRSKFGFIDEERFSWGNLQLGTIAEIENGELARNYLHLGTTLKLVHGLRIRSHGQFDLDLLDQSEARKFISVTRFRSSLNWRILRGVTANLRYSYRENVIDLLDSVETEFDEAARHSWNSGLSWVRSSGLTIGGQATYRTDGTGRNIQIYGLTVNHRRFTSLDLSLASGGMVMLSYLSEGGRLYASLGKRVLPWLDVDLYDELFMYRIIGETGFRTRHMPEISLSAKVAWLNRLRLRTRFEQEDGELFYRFSLSASRQF
ncbi:MAG: hypothetical protein L3J79_07540 [Candidatus Marinimicrobia bacterium]|nr:hypothetical protein [Candidatus Neomarinimicrobiota bacterium]